MISSVHILGRPFCTPEKSAIQRRSVTAYGSKDKFQAFTAIGIVAHGDPYQVVEMGGGFQPFRRDVYWLSAEEIPIRPILGRLEFPTGKQNWGYQFRFGLFSISDHDMNVIAAAMGADFTR